MLITILCLITLNLLLTLWLIRKLIKNPLTEIRNDLVDVGFIKNEGEILEWEPPVPDEELEAQRIVKELTE